MSSATNFEAKSLQSLEVWLDNWLHSFNKVLSDFVESDKLLSEQALITLAEASAQEFYSFF